MQSRSCLFIYLRQFPSHICYKQTAAAGSHLSDTPAAGSSWLGAALRMRGSLRAPLSWRWRAELPGLSRKRAQRSGANADNPTQSEECAGEQPAHLRPPLSSAGAAVGLALLQLVSFGAFVLASALPGCQVWVLSDNSWKLRAERSREELLQQHPPPPALPPAHLLLRLLPAAAAFLSPLNSINPSVCYQVTEPRRGEEKRGQDSGDICSLAVSVSAASGHFPGSFSAHFWMGRKTWSVRVSGLSTSELKGR